MDTFIDTQTSVGQEIKTIQLKRNKLGYMFAAKE